MMVKYETRKTKEVNIILSTKKEKCFQFGKLRTSMKVNVKVQNTNVTM